MQIGFNNKVQSNNSRETNTHQNNSLANLSLPKAPNLKKENDNQKNNPKFQEDKDDPSSFKVDGKTFSKHEALIHLKKLGYQLNFENPTSELLIGYKTNYLEKLNTLISLGVPSSLNPENKDFKITLGEYKITQKDNGDKVLSLYDNLKNPPTLVASIEINEKLPLNKQNISFILSKNATKLENDLGIKVAVEALKPQYEKLCEDYKKEFDKISIEPEIINKTYSGIKLIAAEEKQSINDNLINSIVNIKLTINPEGDYSTRVITFNSENFDLIKNKAIKIDGEIQHLSIKLKPNRILESIKYDERKSTITSLGEEFKFLESEFVKKSKEVTDKYGNKLYLKAKNGEYDLDIELKSSHIASKNKYEEVNIDLSEFGIEDFPKALSIRSLNEVKLNTDVKVLSSKVDSLNQKQKENISAFLSGAHSVLSFFGKEGLVKNVVVIDTISENAFIKPIDKDTIYIHDEILKISPENLMRIGIHEATHLVDHIDDKAISNGMTTKFYNSLFSLNLGIANNEESEYSKSKNFFNNLNESSFFETGVGGHSQDNPKELFASFITSLTNPSWRGKMLAESLDFDKKYLHLLNAVETDLKNSNSISKDAPIFNELDERKKILEGIIKEKEQ